MTRGFYYGLPDAPFIMSSPFLTFLRRILILPFLSIASRALIAKLRMTWRKPVSSKNAGRDSVPKSVSVCAPRNDDFNQIHLVLQKQAEIVYCTGSRFFPVQVDYAANQFLGLHGALLDLSHSICHGIILFHHSMVEFTDRKDPRHQVAEVMNQSIGQGRQPFPPNGIGQSVFGDRLTGDVDQHPVIAQKLLGSRNDWGADIQKVHHLTGWGQLDAVGKAEGFRTLGV